MHVCRRAGLLTRNGNWKQRPRYSVAQETDGRRFQATFKLHNREMSSGTRAQRNYLRTANSASVPGSSLNPQRIHHCSWTPGPAQLHTTPLGNFHIPTDEGSTSEGDTNEKNGEGVKTEHVGASLPSTQAQEVMPDNEEKRWSTTSDPIRDQLLSGARNETESDGDSDLSKKGTGGYSLEELLDRIAKAQLQTDEHMVETQFISEKKRPKIRRKTLMTIDELVNFLREENAHDMCVLKIPPEREYVDYFVVCGGLGTRHIRMMADNLVAEVKGCGDGRGGRVRVEGRDCDDWMVVDLGFAVVHMMLDEARRRYELEKLWALGPQYDDQFKLMQHWLQMTEDTALK